MIDRDREIDINRDRERWRVKVVDDKVSYIRWLTGQNDKIDTRDSSTAAQ